MKKLLMLMLLGAGTLWSQTSTPSAWTTNFALRQWASGATPSADSLNQNWIDIDAAIQAPLALTGNISGSPNLTGAWNFQASLTLGKVSTTAGNITLFTDGGTGNAQIFPASNLGNNQKDYYLPIGDDVDTLVVLGSDQDLTDMGNITGDHASFDSVYALSSPTTLGFGTARFINNSGSGLGSILIAEGQGTKALDVRGSNLVLMGVTDIGSLSQVQVQGSNSARDTLQTWRSNYNGTLVASIDSTGNMALAGVVAANGASITTDDATFGLLDATATTINFGGAATTMTIGSTGGTTTIDNDLAVSDQISSINTMTTEGNFGVPIIVDVVSFSTQGSTLGPTDITNSVPTGQYRVSVYLECDGVDGGVDDVSVTLTWEGDISEIITETTSTLTLATEISQLNHIFFVDHSGSLGSTIMTYTVTYTDNGGGGADTYNVRIITERLN